MPFIANVVFELKTFGLAGIEYLNPDSEDLLLASISARALVKSSIVNGAFGLDFTFLDALANAVTASCAFTLDNAPMIKCGQLSGVGKGLDMFTYSKMVHG